MYITTVGIAQSALNDITCKVPFLHEMLKMKWSSASNIKAIIKLSKCARVKDAIKKEHQKQKI